MAEQNFEVYIAGPLFNADENSHNRKLARMFREAGYQVFNPIEDGIEGATQTNLSDDELLSTIFELDSERVRNARIFVANLNGAQVDDGTSVEIGIAAESQRLRKLQELKVGVEVMIGYFNDTRTITPNMRRNPLPIGPFLKEPNVIFTTRKQIVVHAVENYPPRQS